MLYDTVPWDPARHQIFNLHIRKTGGTSLHAALLGAFGPAEGERVRGMSRLTIWTDGSGLLGLHARLRRRAIGGAKAVQDRLAALRGARLVEPGDLLLGGGHVTFATIPRGRREILPVTLIREPVARFVSDYRFMQGKRDRSRADCLDATLYRLPLAAFAERMLKDPALFRWNTQCLQIAGIPDFAAARDVIDRDFWLAGTTERMQDLADLIARATGRRIGSVPHMRNTGAGRRDGLPPDLAAGLAARLAEDARLHRWVGAELERLKIAARP